MGRAGTAVVLLCALAACAGRRQLNLLEEEKLRFRAENETIRAADLEQRYAEQKRKSDALSEEILVLERRRDRLYTEYDVARAEVVRLERDSRTAAERRGALERALAEAKAEAERLDRELDAERRAIEDLEAKLAAARARRAALDSPAAGTPAPE